MHFRDRSILFSHTQLTRRRDAERHTLERLFRIQHTHRLILICKYSLIGFLQRREISRLQEFFLILLERLQHRCDYFRPIDRMPHFDRQ